MAAENGMFMLRVSGETWLEQSNFFSEFKEAKSIANIVNFCKFYNHQQVKLMFKSFSFV